MRERTEPAGRTSLDRLEPRLLLSAVEGDAAISGGGTVSIAAANQTRAKRSRVIGQMLAGFGGVTEGAAGTQQTLIIPIKRKGPKALLGPASVAWETVTAPTSIPASVNDFAAASGVVNFAPGKPRAFVEITTFGNNIKDGNRHVAIRIFDPVGGTIRRDMGLGGIIDDDGNDNPNPPPPQLPNITPVITLAGPGSVSEGNSGTKTFNFLVKLSAATSKTVKVSYKTNDGSAFSPNNPAVKSNSTPADFTAKSGTLTFNPGETTKTIAITVNGDANAEPDETFDVQLLTPDNGTFAKAVEFAQATIKNDDGAYSLKFQNITTGNMENGVFVPQKQEDFTESFTHVRFDVTNTGPNMAPKGGGPHDIPMSYQGLKQVFRYRLTFNVAPGATVSNVVFNMNNSEVDLDTPTNAGPYNIESGTASSGTFGGGKAISFPANNLVEPGDGLIGQVQVLIDPAKVTPDAFVILLAYDDDFNDIAPTIFTHTYHDLASNSAYKNGVLTIDPKRVEALESAWMSGELSGPLTQLRALLRYTNSNTQFSALVDIEGF